MTPGATIVRGGHMWHVYELRAGEWFYFGCSNNPDWRRYRHRAEMLTRLRHPEAPNTGPHGRAKPKCWLPAIKQYPKARDWQLRVLSSHSCRADAEAEEERLIAAARGNPGRLNRSERADGSSRRGHKIDIDIGRDIRAQIDPLRPGSAERGAAVTEWCRRLDVCKTTIYAVLKDDRYLPEFVPEK